MREGVEIRRGQASDGPGVARVKLAAWRQQYADILPAEYLSAMTTAGAVQLWESTVAKLPTWVAVLEGTVVGYAIRKRTGYPEMPHQQELGALYVHPDVQGRKIGAQLTAAFVRDLLRDGERGCVICSFSANSRARTIYSGWGGQDYGEGVFTVDGVPYPDQRFVFDDLSALHHRLAPVSIRGLSATDDLERITEVLHAAYGQVAEREGLRFLASHQTSEVTRERIEGGVATWVAECHGSLIGTVTLHPCRTYSTDGYKPPAPTCWFGQFAIDPEYQRLGLGSRMLRVVEEEARAQGAQYLALDTAQPATGLIAFYEREGFTIVAEVDWQPVTNYLSWVMIKPL